jgi:hypothetical protein
VVVYSAREQEDDITLVALERAAADPAVRRPVELGRPATAAAAIPLVAGGAGPVGPARRVLVEEPTGTAEDAAMTGMRAGRHGG